MTIVNWEYCDLRLIHFSIDLSGHEVDEQVAQALVVTYHTPSGQSELKVLRENKVKQIRTLNSVESDIFGMALGKLGAGGWELVTINRSEDRRDIATSMIAYFKRPILEGRPTSTPAIEL